MTIRFCSMMTAFLLLLLAMPSAVVAQGLPASPPASSAEPVQYELLARFQIEQDYFSPRTAVARNVSIQPTADTLLNMQRLGIVSRANGASLTFFIRSDAVDRLRAGEDTYAAWMDSDAIKSLVFEIATNDPLFWAYTAPPTGGRWGHSVIWTRSDQLENSNGDLVISTVPRSAPKVFGYFELHFAAQGGPLSSLFSSEGPRIEPQDYRLSLAARQVRQQYFLIGSGSLEPDDWRIEDAAGQQLAYDVKQVTLPDGRQAIQMTSAEAEPLRTRQVRRLDLMRRTASGWDRAVSNLPWPSPDALRLPADGAQDGSEPLIADIYLNR